MSLQLDALDRLDAASAQLRALLQPVAPPVGTAVHPSDNLLALLAAAPAGAIFLLDPACLFLIPGLVLSKPVTLQSAVDPGPSRVGAAWAGPILRGDLTITAPGVDLIGLRLEGAVKEATILTTGPQTLIDRCVILGSAQGQHRGVCANSAGVTLRKSWIGNIWAQVDAQAVAAWTGCSSLLIDDCYLEASGENLCFGGTDDALATLDSQDVGITNNTITKPLAWKGDPTKTCKNLIEIKDAQRVRIAGNTCSNSWLSGQDGYGLVLTVRDQSGGSPWSTITDVTVEDNTFSHLGGGINILGQDYTFPSGRMARVVLQRNQFTDLNPPVWGGSGRVLLIGGGPQALSILNNLFAGAGLNSAITFSGTVPSNTCTGLVVTGNTFPEGDYGIQGDNAPGLGKAALDLYAPGYQWSANTLVRNPGGLRSDGSAVGTIVYPPGTTMA